MPELEKIGDAGGFGKNGFVRKSGSRAAALQKRGRPEAAPTHQERPPARLRRTNAKGLGFFFDGDFDFGGDVAEDLDGDREFAEGLDGIGELHLALVHLKALAPRGLRRCRRW